MNMLGNAHNRRVQPATYLAVFTGYLSWVVMDLVVPARPVTSSLIGEKANGSLIGATSVREKLLGVGLSVTGLDGVVSACS